MCNVKRCERGVSANFRITWFGWCISFCLRNEMHDAGDI